ncbi:hypothetical protein [Micromonospora okii]|uniref:hypothetical protein n=1 Tax=Micromonospora okii TaxID=1182970 RepID=UPI001E3A5447|nr:hypothetical protein [Micromonospora okii]
MPPAVAVNASEMDSSAGADGSLRRIARTAASPVSDAGAGEQRRVDVSLPVQGGAADRARRARGHGSRRRPGRRRRQHNPGAFTRAYLDVTIPAAPPAPDAVDHDAPVAALAAAVALDPRLLAPLRDAYARWQDRLEHDGIDTAAATTVRLAVEGWWLAALLGLPPLAADVHRSTRNLLESLTGSTAAQPPRRPRR